MPRDWKPNAPELKQHFNQATQPAQAPRPASVVELKKLESERKPPVAQLHLTMRGTIAATAKSHADQDREAKITLLKKQFAIQRGRARDGFKRAR